MICVLELNYEKYYALKYQTFFITDTNGCAESSRACQNATKLCKYNLLASIDFLKLSAFGINLKFIVSELVAGSMSKISKGWCDGFETGLNIIIAIVQKV